jgi:uncharacterized membrane protein
MSSLVLAAATFLALHVVVSGTRLRDVIVGAIGDGLYRGLFALASLATLVWMARAYAAAPGLHLWQAPQSVHWLAVLLGLPAALLVTIGLTTPNPTTTGAEGLLAEGVPVRGIVRVTRHPFLGGVAIWALAHLLVNGDAASLVLFGTLLALALLGPRLIDAKRARAYGQRWAAFAAQTSVLPFAAIAAGRTRLVVSEIANWRLLLGVVVYVALLAGHRWLIGVPALPQ